VGWLDKVQPRYAATIAEGLSLNLKVGDEVWGRDVIFGEVEDGQPKDPKGLLNIVAPLVRKIYESDTFKLDPNSAAAHTNRGNVYLDQGDYEQAIAAYNQALAINPNYVIAYINRGQAYKALGDPGQAGADFNQALTRLDHPNLDIQPSNHPDLHMTSMEYLSTWISNTRRQVIAYLDELEAEH
jgi:tetratricopeptide (TPR) repeat protein